MDTAKYQGAAYLIGFILPPFIDVLNKHVASSKLRFAISILVSVICGVAITYPSLAFGDVNGFLVACAVVFSEAQVVYNLYWKDSDARAKMQAKMAAGASTPATNPDGTVPPQV